MPDFWPDELEPVPVHDVPETASDERMHVLDVDCWCEPVPDGETAGSARFRHGDRR